MELWLWGIIGILAIIIIALLLKIFLLQKAADEINEGFSSRLTADTNTLIDISSSDKHMRRLADGINKQLRKLRRQKNRFVQGDMELKNAVTNISHDLRTPLTAISGYLDLLDAEEKSENAVRYLEVIKNRMEIMKQLTEELFRYSVITSPDYNASAELLSVNSVLEDSILGFYAAFRERKIVPNIHIPEERVMRTVNRAALSRVFSNLLNNAIKYSDGDLEITLTSHGKIIFSNTASELNEVEIERLFDRFYTVETARKSTGIGLTIARTLIEQMKGSISAEYQNHKLSVCIWLPDDSDKGDMRENK